MVLVIGWRDPSVYNYQYPSSHPDKCPCVLLSVNYFNNNCTETWFSDTTWTGTTSPFTSNSFYNGETYHDGVISENHQSVTPIAVEGPSGKLNLQTIAYIAETATVYNQYPSRTTQQTHPNRLLILVPT